jgi:hypothetical protein
MIGRCFNFGGNYLECAIAFDALASVIFLIFIAICVQLYRQANIDCLANHSVDFCNGTNFVFKQWIEIEFAVFGLNIVAAIVFIAISMCKSRSKLNGWKGDLIKQKTDFITYFSTEICWLSI